MAIDTFDVVVAGAGHNSLIATAYLAKAGFRCLVLEARATIGGNTATEELTLPGFRHDTCSTAHNLIQSSPTLLKDELGLREYGLQYLHPDPVVHMPFPDGTSITQWRDLDRTCAELARFSAADAAAYRRMLAEYDAVKHLFARNRYSPAGWGPSLAELFTEHPEGNVWLRRLAQSAWEIIAGTFEDWHVRTFMLWMSFLTMQPPERPGTGPLAYSIAYGRQQHSWVMPQGGSAALPQALGRLIAAHGGEIRTQMPVVSLVIQGGRCVGVETADGSRFLAQRAVLSTIHVKDLVGMAPASAWGKDFLAGVASWRPGVSMFVAHYATTEPPRYHATPSPTLPRARGRELRDPALPRARGRELRDPSLAGGAGEGGTQTAVAAGIPTSVDRLLRIGSDFLRGQVATDDPVLLVICATVADSSRAPAGHHTLKVIGFQPYELAPSPTLPRKRGRELEDPTLAGKRGRELEDPTLAGKRGRELEDPTLAGKRGRELEDPTLAGNRERELHDWDAIKDDVAARNLAQLRRYAPNLTDRTILASRVESPLDLERFNAHNWHGSCHGGDMSPAQSGTLRPVPGWAQHRLPIPGLYQTGATTHPGGSVSGGPGRNAATVLLRDLGTSIEAAIAAPALAG